MKKHFTLRNRLVLLIISVCFIFTNAHADWKLIKQLDATYATFITKGGNILLSDFRIEKDGGIYISTDEGQTWTKTNAKDYNYNRFIEVDNHLFAFGYGAKIAYSSDEGKTWSEYSYADAVKNIISEENMPYTVCYAATYHNSKLYVADFCGGGIIYSEDFGKTWKNTDLSSLKYVAEEEDGSSVENTENIYQMVSYKGKLYAFGVYFIFRLDESTNKWNVISDKSNFMAVSTIFNNTLLLGRSVPNDDFNTPFILTLDSNEEWNSLPRPTGIMDNNIRAMSSDVNNIYIGLQKGGFYYTPNKGTNWYNISKGLPNMGNIGTLYLTPTQIFTNKDYVYVSIYEPQGDSKKSGLYRFDKSELPGSTAIEKTTATEDISIRISENALYVSSNKNLTISVFNIDGTKMNITLVNGKADISTLKRGIYTYKLLCGNRTFRGKFVRK